MLGQRLGVSASATSSAPSLLPAQTVVAVQPVHQAMLAHRVQLTQRHGWHARSRCGLCSRLLLYGPRLHPKLHSASNMADNFSLLGKIV